MGEAGKDSESGVQCEKCVCPETLLGVTFELGCEDCFGWEREEQLLQEAVTQNELDVGEQ